MLDVMCPGGFPYPTPEHNSEYSCGDVNSGMGGSSGGSGSPTSDGGVGIV